MLDIVPLEPLAEDLILPQGEAPIAQTPPIFASAATAPSTERQYGKARRIWLMDRGVPTEEVLVHRIKHTVQGSDRV